MDNICNICGGSYVYKNGKWICSCCDNIKNEKITNEEIILITNASAKLRMAAFDDAEELYRDFVKKYPKNSEGYWGLLLSKYGIKYEEDYDGKKIPTIYATSIDSVLDDKNYQLALEYADKDQKKYYKQQAQKFESIRQEWVEKASKEPPVDVFICFKDSDEENNITRTDDSYEAQNLYTYLISKGYSVFFSRESLRDKVAEKYEPYIFNALNTAKVMVLYSSSREYMESTWVKNEWTRFLKKIKNGEKQKNSLVVSFEKMSASDLPKAFASCQCMDASKKTFYEDLDNHIRKVINESSAPTTKIDRVEIDFSKQIKAETKVHKTIVTRDVSKYSVKQLTADEKTELKNAKIYLSKGLYNDVLEIVNNLLKMNQNNGEALFLKLCAESKISSHDALIQNGELVEDVHEFEKIIDSSSKKESLLVLELLVSTCSQLLKRNKVGKALDYYKVISQYDFEYGTLLEEMKCKCYSVVSNGDSKVFDKFKDILLPTISDVDEYLDVLKNVVIAFRKSADKENVLKYCEQFLEVFEGDFEVLWIKLTAEIDCFDPNTLHNHIVKFNQFDEFKKLLEYSPNAEVRNKYFELVFNAIIKKVQSKEISNIDKLAQVFDEILKFTDKKTKVANVQYLLKMASGCQLNYRFDLAEKYYVLAVSENKNSHEAYWGLLQSKLKARNNNELIEQDVIISTLPEYHSALVATDTDERASEKYIDIKAKQMKYLETKNAIKETKRKKVKKISIISLITAVAILICAIFGGIGIGYIKESKLKYTLTADGTAYVVSTGKYFKEENVTIPETYKGLKVVSIDKNAFLGNKNLKTITISKNIEKIDKNAFKDCINLTSVKFANESSIKNIEAQSFYGCASLENVTLPNQVNIIGKYAFANCTSLKQINLPESLEVLSEGLFENSFCKTEISLRIPLGITNIEKNVFNNCAKLTKILFEGRDVIPDNFSENWKGNSSFEICLASKILFNLENGNLPEGSLNYIFVFNNDSFTCPVPTKHGYAFKGWSTTRNEMSGLVTNESGVSLSVWDDLKGDNLYAIWELATYSVNYHLSYGVNHVDNINSFNIYSDDIVLYNPTRSGHDFDGWYSDSEFTNKITSIDTSLGTNVDVYAKYNAIYNYSYSSIYGLTDYGKSNYTEIIIPSKIDDVQIEFISSNAFLNCSRLTSVEIPETVIYIGTGAFSGCSGLIKMTIPFVGNRLSNTYGTFGEIFGTSAYDGSIKINQCYRSSNYSYYEDYYIPSSLKSVKVLKGNLKCGAFNNCVSLENIELVGANNLDILSFRGCSNLKSLILPNTITTIESGVFDGCSSLESVYYNGTLNEWANITFKYQNSNPMYYAKKFYLSSDVDNEITALNLSSETITAYSFYGFKNVISINILDTVKNIETYAFAYCSKIENIEVPTSVKFIGYNAFGACTSLTSITLPFVGETETSTGALNIFGHLFDISVTGTTKVSQYYGKSSSTYTAYLPTSLTTVNVLGGKIGYGTFYSCVTLENIYLASTITSFGTDAFNGCTSLKNVYYDSTVSDWSQIKFASLYSNPMYYADNFYINESSVYSLLGEELDLTSVNKVENYVFYGFNGILNIKLSDALTYIGDSSFVKTAITELEIPESVTSIGSGAFAGCKNLTDITIPFVGNARDSVTSKALFGYIFGTTNYTGTVQTRQYYASGDYSTYYIPESLVNVKVLDGLIKYGAFYNCGMLASVQLPGNLSEVGDYAFYNCDSLASITIPKSVTKIKDRAFYSCDKLKDIYYESNIQDWASIQFSNETATPMANGEHFYIKNDQQEWEELKVVNFENVSKISNYSFYGFNNITDIKFGSGIKNIKTYSFAYCSSLVNIDFGGVEVIESNAFKYCSSLTYVKTNSCLKELQDNSFAYCSNLLNFFMTDSVEIIKTTPFYQSNTSMKIYCEGSSKKDGWESSWNDSQTVIYEILEEEFDFIANFNADNYTLLDGVYYYISEDKSDVYALGVSDKTMTDVVLYTKTTRIGYRAFSGCSKVVNITLRGSVDRIANYAFDGCSSLINVYYDGTIEDWCKMVIGNITAATDSTSSPMYYASHFFIKDGDDWNEVIDLVIPDSVIEIKSRTFYGFSNLKSVVINNNVTVLNELSFGNCTKLSSVKLGNSLTTIGVKAFYNCDALRSIYIPDNVQNIKASASYSDSPFYDCYSSLKIYCESLEALANWEIYWNYYSSSSKLTVYYDYLYEEYLFAISTDKSEFTLINNVYYYISEDEQNVYALGVKDKTVSEIVLDERTTRITTLAFSNCTKITSIKITSNVSYIGLKAFSGCVLLDTIYIDSAYVYNNVASKFDCGYLFEHSTTIYVKKDIVASEQNNEYLNDSDIFNKTEEDEYIKYSRI